MNPTERPRGAAPASALPPDVLYTSDLHGSRPLYRETVEMAARLGVRALLLGGDLAPHADIAGQRRFFEEFLVPLLGEHVSRPGSADVYYIFGNDDWKAAGEVLTGAGLARCDHVHGRVVPFLDGTVLAGLASVPITPFGLKDWERWEDGVARASRWEGVRSEPGGAIVDFDFRGREEGESLAAELRAIEDAIEDGRTAICMFHGPPHGTACDQIRGGMHVGSRETRRFLERVRPAIGLHGHIHESPVVSGHYADRIGPTVCVNPGQRLGSALHAVTFRVADPAGTLEHTLLGPPPWR
ncbi:MAG: metallophosphoesterase family protein [Hyphomicrobiales bacterium]